VGKNVSKMEGKKRRQPRERAIGKGKGTHWKRKKRVVLNKTPKSKKVAECRPRGEGSSRKKKETPIKGKGKTIEKSQGFMEEGGGHRLRRVKATKIITILRCFLGLGERGDAILKQGRKN